MSDLQNWPSLVTPVKLRAQDISTGEYLDTWENEAPAPMFYDYVQVPLNEYQMGNLLGALKQVQADGDWYDEIISIIACAMDKAGIKEVTSNQGDVFKLEDLREWNLNGSQTP